MHRIFPRIQRTDPTAFSTVFASWAVVVGISLATPGDYFSTSPIWETLDRLHHADAPWGWAMMLDGVCLYLAPRALAVPYRAAVTLFSAILWAILGGSLIYNGWQHGSFVSIVGIFSLCCAIQAVVATEQWVWTQNRWEAR